MNIDTYTKLELIMAQKIIDDIIDNGLLELSDQMMLSVLCTIIDMVSSKIEMNSGDMLEMLMPTIDEIGEEFGPYKF